MVSVEISSNFDDLYIFCDSSLVANNDFGMKEFLFMFVIKKMFETQQQYFSSFYWRHMLLIRDERMEKIGLLNWREREEKKQQQDKNNAS